MPQAWSAKSRLETTCARVRSSARRFEASARDATSPSTLQPGAVALSWPFVMHLLLRPPLRAAVAALASLDTTRFATLPRSKTTTRAATPAPTRAQSG